MSALLIDAMDNAAGWAALEADGVTPSTELSIADDSTVFGYGADGTSGRIAATGGAAGHVLRRTAAAINLTPFRELRLSVRGDRAAGQPGGPFYLELRLASVAVPLTDPTNTWHRLLPVAAGLQWETVRFGIDDLDPAIAGAVTVVQFACLDADPPFTVNIDDFIAVDPEMVADVDAALEARLSGITAGGAPATAAVRALAEALPAPPALDLLHLDFTFAPHRVRSIETPRDYTSDGNVRLVPLGEPYDLTYAIRPIASTAPEQAELIEAVVDRLQPSDELVVHGERLPVEAVRIPMSERPGGGDERLILHYRVGLRRASTVARVVRAVDEVRVEADYLVAP